MYDISFAVSVTSYTLWFLHDDAVWGRPPPSAAPVGWKWENRPSGAHKMPLCVTDVISRNTNCFITLKPTGYRPCELGLIGLVSEIWPPECVVVRRFGRSSRVLGLYTTSADCPLVRLRRCRGNEQVAAPGFADWGEGWHGVATYKLWSGGQVMYVSLLWQLSGWGQYVGARLWTWGAPPPPMWSRHCYERQVMHGAQIEISGDSHNSSNSGFVSCNCGCAVCAQTKNHL